MSGSRYFLDTNAIVAAMALQTNAKLVTADQEFAKVSMLTVISW